jgi:4-hydroxybenzoate polyprenyltransferase
MYRTADPTLRLLSSSVPVGFSGALRVCIAFLLAGISPYPLPCAAAGLVIYATYTLDRAIPCAEDEINQRTTASANRRTVLAWCGLTYLLGLLLFLWDGILLAPLVPLVIGYLYTRGISFGSHTLKLKGGAGAKNMVIGLTWGGCIALVIAHFTLDPLVVIPIFLFYGIKLFINSSIFDMKDLEGDLAAGIRTLPACLGEARTKHLLGTLSLVLHGLMAAFILAGPLRPELAILSYSVLIWAPFILCYSSGWELADGIKSRLRGIVIDGESALALGIRCAMGLVPAVIVPGYG